MAIEAFIAAPGLVQTADLSDIVSVTPSRLWALQPSTRMWLPESDLSQGHGKQYLSFPTFSPS